MVPRDGQSILLENQHLHTQAGQTHLNFEGFQMQQVKTSKNYLGFAALRPTA